jgi:hypothetical protein
MAKANLTVDPNKETGAAGKTDTPVKEDAAKKPEQDSGMIIASGDAAPASKPAAIAELSPACPGVQEVFGKFAAEINGKVELFETYQEAKEAFVTYAKTAEFTSRAVAYLKARELDPESKMAKGRLNVIKDFLSFEASL